SCSAIQCSLRDDDDRCSRVGRGNWRLSWKNGASSELDSRTTRDECFSFTRLTKISRGPMSINSPETIQRILSECQSIAVVGLSSDSSRPSNSVSGYMRRQGYKVIPVNPNEREVFGDRAYGNLAEVPDKVDLVDIFRRSDEAGRAVEKAIAVGAKAV